MRAKAGERVSLGPRGSPDRVNDTRLTPTIPVFSVVSPPFASLSSFPGIRYEQNAASDCHGIRMKMEKKCFIAILTTMANQCYGLKGARKVNYYGREKQLLFNEEPLVNRPFSHSRGCKWISGPVR